MLVAVIYVIGVGIYVILDNEDAEVYGNDCCCICTIINRIEKNNSK